VSKQFTVMLPSLAPAAYTVLYRVVSADDGHISSGTIRFRYSPGTPAARQARHARRWARRITPASSGRRRRSQVLSVP